MAVLTEPGIRDQRRESLLYVSRTAQTAPGSASTVSDAARLLAQRSSRGHPRRTPQATMKPSACLQCGEIHGVRAMQRHRAAAHPSRKSLKTQALA